MPDQAEHPDEEPLDEQDLINSIEVAGFNRKLTTKGYEIFHLNYPPHLGKGFLQTAKFVLWYEERKCNRNFS